MIQKLVHLKLIFHGLLLAFGSLIYASVNDPLRWEWKTGYRNDTLHWHLTQETDTAGAGYSERCRNLQFWQNSIAVRTIHRDIALFLCSSYGAFGQGNLKQKYSNAIFYRHPKSWNFDAWGYFGYAVDLTAGRHYHVIATPMAGYGIDVERLNCKERFCCFGPCLGALFIIHPGGNLRFEGGYAYHWIHLRFQSQMKTPLFDSIKANDGSNLEHSGWARMEYTAGKYWRIGLESQIQYFCSRILNAAVTTKTERSSQKFKSRWTAISGTLAVSRVF